MSCPTISSIGLLARKRLFNFFTALHLLLATKDGGQRGSRAACCFLVGFLWPGSNYLGGGLRRGWEGTFFCRTWQSGSKCGHNSATQCPPIAQHSTDLESMALLSSHKWWHQHQDQRLSANGVEVPVFKSAPSRFPVSSTCFMCLPPRLQDTDNCRRVSALGKIFYCIGWI